MAVKGGRAVPEVGEQVKAAATELIKLAGLGPGQLLVIGCSTSEVLGRRIGTAAVLPCPVADPTAAIPTASKAPKPKSAAANSIATFPPFDYHKSCFMPACCRLIEFESTGRYPVDIPNGYPSGTPPMWHYRYKPLPAP
jgi:hypothetical protein